MSNDVTNNPLILDTAADNVVTGPLRITKIIWDAGDTPADVAQIEDGSERVIWKRTLQDVGTAANVYMPPLESDFVPPLLVTGLSVGVLDSGVVYVYHEGPNPVKTT